MKNATGMSLKDLNRLLRKNKSIDFRTHDFLRQISIDQLNWKGLEDEKNNLIPQLKAYQRMLRIVPEDDTDIAKELLEMGISSSLQIAEMGKKMFIEDSEKAFRKKPELAQDVYQKALTLRKLLALQYIDQIQRSEAHSKAAGLNK
ncbi:hypothetical protein [Aliikangiella coralliicola]|uniref:Uncharacterized protein n=1 Tax=Aliikangiella coralliicola TaxID=2592383 RepID=A0A545U901_9GAMM|nr:hypothetical protein [Aliikangiella coralliicola]TQV85944.1 hypothetical protein FLL46_18675 [Aliikangiella coralliicola]